MQKIINLKPVHKLSLSAILALIIICTAIYAYRDAIFKYIQDPRQPFQTYSPPAAPIYTDPQAWLALPDLSQDPFSHPARGDVFVVVPSVYRGGEHWNLPTDDLKRKRKLQRIVRPNYVSPYGQAGRLFAPYYRQASLFAFMTTREDAIEAQDLAYQDVRRAFEFFLENSPPERPLVLVGHNQGASHVQRLLMEFFQGPLKERLSVAYIIDYPLALEQFNDNLQAQQPCAAKSQVNCIIAFGSFTPEDRVIADRFVNELLVYQGSDYQPIAGKDLLCVNPLIWKLDEDYVPRRLHKGGVAAEGLDPDMDPAPLNKQVGAQCQNGILLVDKPRSRSLRRPIQVGAKFRTLPSNLFYEDLKQNAVTRVNALIESGRLPKRVEKLDNFDVVDIVDSPVTPVTE